MLTVADGDAAAAAAPHSADAFRTHPSAAVTIGDSSFQIKEEQSEVMIETAAWTLTFSKLNGRFACRTALKSSALLLKGAWLNLWRAPTNNDLSLGLGPARRDLFCTPSAIQTTLTIHRLRNLLLGASSSMLTPLFRGCLACRKLLLSHPVKLSTTLSPRLASTPSTSTSFLDSSTSSQ
jgi:hypothetical protein